MTWRDDVVEEAQIWLNTPYHSGARVKGVGVDCGQILIAVYEKTGIILAGDCDPETYSNEFHLHRSEEIYLSWVKKYCDITDSEPLPGDIAVFQYGRCVSHAGIVVEWPRIIHSYVQLGVILSDINEAILIDNSGKSRLRGIYRIKGRE